MDIAPDAARLNLRKRYKESVDIQDHQRVKIGTMIIKTEKGINLGNGQASANKTGLIEEMMTLEPFDRDLHNSPEAGA